MIPPLPAAPEPGSAPEPAPGAPPSPLQSRPASRQVAGSSRLLMWGAAALCVAGIALSLAVFAGLLAWPLAYAVAVFMTGFGLVKAVVALQAVRAVRAGIAPDPRDLQASTTAFWVWVGLKCAVAALAIGLALWLVTHPEACDRLLGMRAPHP